MLKLKKIFDIFSLQEKKQAFYLFLLILIMAFFDVLGVASIMPFISVLANPKLIETNNILAYLYFKSNFFGVNTINQFLFFLGIAVFILLLTSLSVRAITYYAQIRFALMREFTISKKLTESYLRQPYTWFLKKHSADLSKNVLSEVSQVIDKTIVPIINLLVNSIVALALFILLIIIDLKLALSITLIFGLSYACIFLFTKKILHRMGLLRLILNTSRFQVLGEVFNAVKEVKLSGLENEFLRRFSEPAEKFAKNESLSTVIFQVPRFFIEAIAFGSIIILALILLDKNGNFANIVSLLALYAFAGYRLIPTFQTIYSSASQLKFSGPALDSIHKDLIDLENSENIFDETKKITFNKSIELKNVSYNYPDSSKYALKNINIKIKLNSKIGIVGRTGSGKTTLVDLILALLDVSNGNVYVDENIITKKNKRSWQINVGYVPQQIHLTDNTILSNIAFGVNFQNINQEAVIRAAKVANLHDFIIKDLPKKYDTLIGENGVKLSGGQRQRIGIARALYRSPKILVLDEATNSLDNITEKAITEAIDQLSCKVTIILVTHRLDTLRKFDNIFLIEDGQVKAQGNYEELLKNKNFKEMVVTGTN